MINFELKYENLIEREIHNNLIVTETKDLNIIESCINLFNSEIIWEKMFTIKDSEIRIKNGDVFDVNSYIKNASEATTESASSNSTKSTTAAQ